VGEASKQLLARWWMFRAHRGFGEGRSWWGGSRAFVSAAAGRNVWGKEGERARRRASRRRGRGVGWLAWAGYPAARKPRVGRASRAGARALWGSWREWDTRRRGRRARGVRDAGRKESVCGGGHHGAGEGVAGTGGIPCDGTSQVIRPTYSCPCPTDIRQPCRCS
jgi:hypothetical protein